LNELLTALRFTNNLGLKLNQWMDKNNRQQTRFGTLNVRCLYMPGLLKAVATVLAKYKLFCRGVQFEKAGQGMGSRL
jgi:hypothetical protein